MHLALIDNTTQDRLFSEDNENMCLTPFQCLFVGELLYMANKFTGKVMSGRVLLTK